MYGFGSSHVSECLFCASEVLHGVTSTVAGDEYFLQPAEQNLDSN